LVNVLTLAKIKVKIEVESYRKYLKNKNKMYLGKDRKLNRWFGYDYAIPGHYFITICTQNRIPHFGEIIGGKMLLNDLGKIVNECWFDLSNHYKHCKLDEFVIMPNHVHGIIEIINNEYYKTAVSVGNGFKPFPTIHGLSEIVRGFKTFSSRKINKLQNNYFQWQKSFHDRVIRDEQELIDKRYYIQQNPAKWAEDSNNPANIK